MSIITLVLLGVLPVLGFVAGAVVGRLTRRKPYVEPKAVCEGCNHHTSYHEEEGGRCHHIAHYEYSSDVECTCLRYIGPVPMPTYLPGIE